MEPLFFYVSLQNVSPLPVKVSAERFSLEHPTLGVQSPLDLRAEAPIPTEFIDNGVLLPPGGTVKGLLAFDGRGWKASDEPASLSYLDVAQTLQTLF